MLRNYGVALEINQLLPWSVSLGLIVSSFSIRSLHNKSSFIKAQNKYQISIWLAIYHCLSCLIHLSIFWTKFVTISILLYFFIFHLHFLRKLKKTYIVHLTWTKPSVLYKQSVTELSKWESKHWLCTIHNGSLETFIWSIMWTKKFKYCELSQVREGIFVIGVILETLMDASLETPPWTPRWRPPWTPRWRPPWAHIFNGDPHIFIADPNPIFSLETPRFSLEIPRFYWRPHIFAGDPYNFIKTPQIFI